ncbi:uncharacterized protein LOC126607212 isoform X1 [Malus sylvestris]|uniref:uncharacterized protein LOC126607212 isoform X1 n=2 Tax=Malus sylvestris TaxID=3752 RepID=UPI0021ABAD67|nr:uncharacterized protein LOC126607212 isoform X1 [Malus sylvestris]
MSGMYCVGESSNNGNKRHFYQGESSNTGANRQVHYGGLLTQNGSNFNGNVGFVGQYQRSSGYNYNGIAGNSYNGNAGGNKKFGGFNGPRNNYRPWNNAGYNGGNGSNGGFSGSSGSYQSKNGSSSRGSSSNFWSNLNGNNGQRSNVIPECQICSKRGHTAPNCFYRNEQQLVYGGSIPECQICGQRSHVALNCYHMRNYAFQGATHHMMGDMADLNLVTLFEGDQKIIVGNGKRPQ